MAHEVQFVRGTFYKAGGGMTHLKHALRDKFDSQRIPEPDIRISKYDGSLTETTKAELYDFYNYNLKHRQRKNANVYFEYMVSDYDPEKTLDIARYLHEKFEGRPVFAVEHRDEGHYHTHFFIFSKDPAHLKSPNLKKQDLHMLRVNVGKITGQKVKEKGTGLQKHVGLSSDPERTKELVAMQQQEAERMKQIQEQIKPILSVYGAIEIYSLNIEKGVRFRLYNGSGRTVFDDVEQIPVLKLLRLDDKPGENVVFVPVPFEKEGKKYVRGVFLDDVPRELVEEQPEALPDRTVIVETSPGKYQAHIPLPKPFDVDTADQLQRLLVDYYQSDVGAKWLLHPRRMPGLKNKKYLEKPVAKVVKTIHSDVSINRLLAEIEINTKQHMQMQNQRWTLIEKKSPKIAQQIEEVLELEGESTWQRFFEESGGDRSSADMKYVLRLLRKGYDPQAVAYALMEISPDLIIRKPKHVEDYVERTITKALSILQPVSQEKEQNHNPEK